MASLVLVLKVSFISMAKVSKVSFSPLSLTHPNPWCGLQSPNPWPFTHLLPLLARSSHFKLMVSLVLVLKVSFNSMAKVSLSPHSLTHPNPWCGLQNPYPWPFTHLHPLMARSSHFKLMVSLDLGFESLT